MDKPELKINYHKMGMRPRNATWEWYSAEIGKIANIHIHNENGKWQFRIITVRTFDSRTFETKEQAYDAAWTALLKMINEILTNA